MAQITNGTPETLPSQIPADEVKKSLKDYNDKAADFATSGFARQEGENKVADEVESATVTSSVGAPVSVDMGGKESADETKNETDKGPVVAVTGCDNQAANDELSEKETEEAKSAANATDFEVLKCLPYIDLYAKHNEAKRNIEDLKSMKAMMDQIGNISDEQYSAMVGKMDAAEREKYEGSVNDFYNRYDGMMAEAKRIEELLARMLLVFDTDMVASTAFISKSMVESAAHRRTAMESADEKPTNYAAILKRLDITAKAYEDRTNFDLLFHKLRYPNNTLETYKGFVKDGPEEALKYINRIFMPVFNDKNMTKFRVAFKKICLLPKLEGANENVVDVIVFFMTYWLAKIYEKEYQSGKCAYVKTFIMNIYDVDPSSNIYDLPGGKDFIINVGYTIYMIIMVSTGGQFTEKELYAKVNAIIDDLMAIVDACRKDLYETTPGRLIELGTDLASITDGITVDDLPELPAPDKAEDDSPAKDADDSEEDESESEGEDDSEEAEPDGDAEAYKKFSETARGATPIVVAANPEDAQVWGDEDKLGVMAGVPTIKKKPIAN